MVLLIRTNIRWGRQTIPRGAQLMTLSGPTEGWCGGRRKSEVGTTNRESQKKEKEY